MTPVNLNVIYMTLSLVLISPLFSKMGPINSHKWFSTRSNVVQQTYGVQHDFEVSILVTIYF